MGSPVSFIVLIVGAAVVLVLAHLYLWRRLVRDTRLPKWARWVTGLAITVLGFLGPVSVAFSRIIPRYQLGPLFFVAFVWMALLFYLLLLLLLGDLVQLLLKFILGIRKRRSKPVASQPTGGLPVEAPVDPGRRVFLSRLVAGSALASAGAITGLGMRSALGSLSTPEVPVKLVRLPMALSGFRIALIADMHLGPTLGRSFTERVVERTNALKPDLIAIVGDLVDAPPEVIGEDVAPLRRLHAPHGVFFSTGNHEYYVGVEPWLEFIEDLGIRVLSNERVEIGKPGACFDLVGIPDRSAARYGPGPDLGRTLAGRDPDRELVLLAHQPAQVVDAAEARVGLQLSGHTHGGQFFPFGGFTLLAQPYLSGLHRHSEHTQIYVTCGTGFWGPPVRVMAPAEITQIVLMT